MTALSLTHSGIGDPGLCSLFLSCSRSASAVPPWRHYLQKTARNLKWNSFPRRKRNYSLGKLHPTTLGTSNGSWTRSQSPVSRASFLTNSATEGSQTWKKFPEHPPELTSWGEGDAHSIFYQLELLRTVSSWVRSTLLKIPPLLLIHFLE